MKRYLLIDADSTIPNIALMSISSRIKRRGDRVDFIRLGISYYPNRRKKGVHSLDVTEYDRAFCSVVFGRTFDSLDIVGRVKYGGTGFDLMVKIPLRLMTTDLDYSLYPDNSISYGFITRGCVRRCKFCVVPQKEGYIHLENEPASIIKHNKVKFLDNNILAYADHKRVLRDLIDIGVKCEFNQGLDIRLLDRSNSYLLSQLNYLNEYTFAFDSWKMYKLIEGKLALLSWAWGWRLRFFVYVHPRMPLLDTINRIEFLRKRHCLPYIMRDIACWESSYRNFYTDLASWCNQPGIFKGHTFEEFMNKRSNSDIRKLESVALYENPSSSVLDL